MPDDHDDEPRHDPATPPTPGYSGSFASTGDMRLLAYENAVELADLLNGALTEYQLGAVVGQAPDLDAVAWQIESDSDVVLGARGKRSTRAANVVQFTYRQVIDMAGVLGDLLPALASEAHEARQEHARARN